MLFENKRFHNKLYFQTYIPFESEYDEHSMMKKKQPFLTFKSDSPCIRDTIASSVTNFSIV